MNRRYSVTACFDGNKRVVSGSEDGSIYVWDINSSKSVVQKLQGHNGGRKKDALRACKMSVWFLRVGTVRAFGFRFARVL